MSADKLTFVVENTEDLDAHSRAIMVFGPEGGVIGSEGACDWMLSDRSYSVASRQIQIFQSDGNFSAEVLEGDGVRINNSGRCAHKGTIFQIGDGDRWVIGRFIVNSYIGSNGNEDSQRQASFGNRFVSVEYLVPGSLSKEAQTRQEQTEEIITGSGLSTKVVGIDYFPNRKKEKTETDPLVLLDRATTNTSDTSLDPLELLNKSHDSKFGIADRELADELGLSPDGSGQAQPILDPLPGQENIALNLHQRNTTMASHENNTDIDIDIEKLELDEYLSGIADNAHNVKRPPVSKQEGRELFERDSWLAQSEEGQDERPIDHVVLRPLLSALGIGFGKLTGPQADRLAMEIGEALKQAINGIMDIHQNHIASHASINETHLHPVEDNPLRLEQNPDQAIRDLFMTQSPVHLRAGAAVEESLRHIMHHQEASVAAVESALQATLKALEPERLATRFSRYRGHAPRTGNLDAWHWQMYQHYYKELKSDRQGGLGRMFQEVFTQVYDREMRQKSLEEQV